MDGGERTERDGSAGVNLPSTAVPPGSAEIIDGYLVPVDPMDYLQCDSCQ